MAAAPIGAAASLRGSFPIDVAIRDTTPPRADRSSDRAAVDAILGGQAAGGTREGRADPAALALRAEHSADLRAAVARLDEPYRETIALRFFAERSLAEIAAQTGRPLGTVKTHLHRGLLRLRDALGEP